MILLLASLALADTEPPLAPGLYRLDTVHATQSKVPFAGKVTVYNRGVTRVELLRTSTGWEQRQELCDVVVDDDLKMSTTIIPPAFIAATPRQTYPVHFTRTESGWTYRADPGPLDVGWDPRAAGGVLPEHPDSPGVLDFEGDGHPGATVQLQVPVFGAVEVYVVQRGHTTYTGRVVDGGVQGTLQVVALDQRTIDASHRMFRGNPPVTVLPDESSLSLRPLPPGTTCTDLRAGR